MSIVEILSHNICIASWLASSKFDDATMPVFTLKADIRRSYKKSKNLILRNLRGGISITVDIEVVLSVSLLRVFAHAITRSNDTRHRFYGDRYIVFIRMDRQSYVG